MPTTTNYGWTTPADTDLVKDGASAIRTLGTAIDTTVFNNASAGIAKTIVDAKGDIIAATAADTVSRLAVGANDTVLTADSSTATGLKWAAPAAGGGMTLLSTTTLSGASTTISTINQTYKSLVAYIYKVNLDTTADFIIRPNAVTNLIYGITNFNEDGTAYTVTPSNTTIKPPGNVGAGQTDNAFTLTFDNYASTTSFKPYSYRGYYRYSASVQAGFHTGGAFKSDTAISSLEFAPASGSFSGGTVLLYGVN